MSSFDEYQTSPAPRSGRATKRRTKLIALGLVPILPTSVVASAAAAESAQQESQVLQNGQSGQLESVPVGHTFSDGFTAWGSSTDWGLASSRSASLSAQTLVSCAATDSTYKSGTSYRMIHQTQLTCAGSPGNVFIESFGGPTYKADPLVGTATVMTIGYSTGTGTVSDSALYNCVYAKCRTSANTIAAYTSFADFSATVPSGHSWTSVPASCFTSGLTMTCNLSSPGSST